MVDTAVHSFTQKTALVSTDEFYLAQSPYTSGHDRKTTLPDIGAFFNLQVDAANVLAQRNGVNAQAFRIYATFTDASNYTRMVLGWDPTLLGFVVANEGAGTGGSNVLQLTAGGANQNGVAFIKLQTDSSMSFGKAGTATYWQMSSSGNLLGGTDNTYDIGASGANRPRTGYFGTSVITPALRIDQAPTAVGTGVKTISSAADSSTNFGHYFSINLNGTTYYIPCSSVALT